MYQHLLCSAFIVCLGDPGKVANSTSNFDPSIQYRDDDTRFKYFEVTCDVGMEAEADVTVQTVSCEIEGWDTSHLLDCKPG